MEDEETSPSLRVKQPEITDETLLDLTECATLNEILVISLRNRKLVSFLRLLSYCKNLRVAYCQNNRVSPVEIALLPRFDNLVKLDLSNNELLFIPTSVILSEVYQLKVLFLHNNRLSQWNDLLALSALPSLLHLTLFSNPVSVIPGYRHFLVNASKSLLALDEFVITDEERIEDASYGTRFRSLNKYMKIFVPEFLENLSAEQHLFNLDIDIYRLKRIYERNSPILRI